MIDVSYYRRNGRSQKKRYVLPAKEKVRRILIIKLRHLGDVLLITPLITTLKRHYPQALIDVLLYYHTEVMLTGNHNVNFCYTVDRSLKHQKINVQFRGEKALLSRLKKAKYDLIINLSDQWRAAFYCRYLKPELSIGFAWPRRHNVLWRLCHRLLVATPFQQEMHVVAGNLSILQPLNLPDRDTAVVLSWQHIDEQNIAKLLKKQALQCYVLIHPGARWAFKTWSAEAFAHLINHLIEKKISVVLAGGHSEQEKHLAAAIVREVPLSEKIVNLSGQLTLPELAAVISRARLFVGVDSAPMHMAAALQIPSVVLFGATNVRQWHPWQAPHTLIWAGDYRALPPVNEVNTDTPERYLEAIPVGDVIAAVDKWLFA